MAEKQPLFTLVELSDEERELGLKFWKMELEMTYEKGLEVGRAQARERREKEFQEGVAEGIANSILRVLSIRGVDLPTEDRARLMACRDHSVLKELVVRALTLQSGEDLFEGQPDERSTG